MKLNKKLLTIITVVKNDVSNIAKTIVSVTSQKVPEIEYIIIDGNSKDGTDKKIKTFQNKIDKIIREQDYGIYNAMNKGLDLSTGKYVCFCNSGDYFKKNSLKVILHYLKKNIDVLFATVERKYTNASIIKCGYNLKRLNYNFDFATSHSTGFFIKKDLNKKIGYYDEKFKCSADYDLYLRLFKIKELVIDKTPINKVIGVVANGGFSSTLSPLKHLHEEIQIRKKNNQNVLLIVLIIINAIVKILFKKIFSYKKKKKLKIIRVF